MKHGSTHTFKSLKHTLTAVFMLVWCGSSPFVRPAAAACHDNIRVFVSIAPQAYFVKRIGADHVNVEVMVGPGQSPATYEPRPRQMAALGQASLYFRIGVPFESVWMERIAKANPHLCVIDTRHGITLLPIVPNNAHRASARVNHAHGMDDPHIWLSPRLVKIQAQNICDALIEQDRIHETDYRKNLKAFCKDLDALDATIAGLLRSLKDRTFLVFHPSWGYFARDYGLEQIAIETEGKPPSARALTRIIELAKQKNIRVIFVQKQFSKRSARAVAQAIKARVIEVDPLAQDYFDNMKRLAQTLAETLR
ncbi:MAG: zinc ABC transporter substrate-binding protein [Deltaproteobacteria bacterium]|nr:zinc ABC transporter substrate-binding protein [Deltaproteobacteria bacterium]